MTSSIATREQVQSIHRRSKARTPEEELERKLVPKLASRSYHLPGYNLRQDYFQYMFNNHPFWGICCHHKLHPLKTRQRLIILLGSFAFGVAITNAIYLWFLNNPNYDETSQVFSVNLSTQQSKSQSINLTSGLIALVTVGSGTHAIFDRFIWVISACSMCKQGGRFERSHSGCTANLGWYLVIVLVTAVVAIATCIVLVRASMDEGQTGIPIINRNATNTTVKEDIAQILDFNDFSINDYSFLKGYVVEFCVSLFGWYPLMETLFFSGILGCFTLPFLGGRPMSMKKEAKAKEKEFQTVRTCPTDMT